MRNGQRAQGKLEGVNMLMKHNDLAILEYHIYVFLVAQVQQRYFMFTESILWLCALQEHCVTPWMRPTV